MNVPLVVHMNTAKAIQAMSVCVMMASLETLGTAMVHVTDIDVYYTHDDSTTWNIKCNIKLIILIICGQL